MCPSSFPNLTWLKCLTVLLVGLVFCAASPEVQALPVPSANDSAGEGEQSSADKVVSFQEDLALWSLVVFLLFLWLLSKFAWGPMIQGLDDREAKLRAIVAEAEDNQRKSQAVLAEYEGKLRDAEHTVAEMVAEAKRDAERTSQDIVAKAQSEVQAMKDRATEEITRAKDWALSEVFEHANSQVVAATERVLGRALSDEDQERLVQDALTEIS